MLLYYVLVIGGEMCIIKQGVTKSSNRVMHVSCLQFYYSHIYITKELWSLMVYYRLLSRRLERCDRVIKKESDDSNGSNVQYVTMNITFVLRKSRNG